MRRIGLAFGLLVAGTSAALALASSSIPTKVPTYWGQSASGANITCPIPIPSQIGITPGRASWTDGFPPLTFLPSGAGGVPPFGQDVNGAFCQISQWVRWFNAAGAVPYDPTFQSQIGGYPSGAIVPSASNPGVYWQSTVDNNLSDPDTGGANWTGFSLPEPHGQSYRDVGANFFVVPPGVFSLTFEAWGGGGGGSGNLASTIGSGGGGGGYGKQIIAVTPGQVISYSVGAGGPGGASGGNNNGTAGGNTTVTVGATTYTAFGGGAGQADNGANSAGGDATGFSFSIPANQGWVTGGKGVFSGGGGSSPRGGGGGVYAQPNGLQGSAPGGGGGPGLGPVTNNGGGAGATGAVLFTW